MLIDIKKSFSKDIDKIRDKKILNSILDIINEIENAVFMKDIKNIKKLAGTKNYNHIKIDDYRLGLFIENNIISLVRIIHRKEVYKYVS